MGGVIYAVRGTAHTLFPVDGLCLCMTYPINGRAVTRAKSKRRVRFMVSEVGLFWKLHPL